MSDRARLDLFATRKDAIPLVILWMAGVCLRVTILAVPPVVRLLHKDLLLSESDIGLLSSVPPLMFAIAAVPGAMLIGRFGIRATLLAGLVANAVASASRGVVHSAGFLYVTTIIMAAGVAIMQPALPSLVRLRFPGRSGFATAVYSNGLLVGEVLVVGLTIPLVLPLVGNRWELSFAVWATPVVLTALLVLARGKTLFLSNHPGVEANSCRPDWNNALVWRLGLLLGSVNALYFGANAFLPDFTAAAGYPKLIGSALTALNLGQLPASFLMLAAADSLVRRRWVYIGTALLSFVSTIGIMATTGLGIVFWSGVLGFSSATTLVLAFALPPILSEPEDVHRISAGMFTVSYSWAMTISVVSGVLWDWTGSPRYGFAPLVLCALLGAIVAFTFRFKSTSSRLECCEGP